MKMRGTLEDMSGGTQRGETWGKKRRNGRRGLDMKGGERREAFTTSQFRDNFVQGRTIYHPMSEWIYERAHTSLS